jgi:hypothetical protein
MADYLGAIAASFKMYCVKQPTHDCKQATTHEEYNRPVTVICYRSFRQGAE